MNAKTYRILFVAAVAVLTVVFVVAMASAQPPERDGQRRGGGQRPERGRQMFERLRNADTDKDGKISAEEAKAAELPERMVQALDSNGDGDITRNELASRGGGRDGEETRGQKPGGQESRPDIGEALIEADKDRNGFVSREEFASAITRAPGDLFDRLDTNDDGKLSRDEIALASRAPEFLRRIQTLVDSFDSIDKDKNGALDIAELQAADAGFPKDAGQRIDADGDTSISREELQRVVDGARREMHGPGREGHEDRGPMMGRRMAEADTNGDDKISRKEFETAMPDAPKDIFDRIDANGDGEIAKDELARLQQRFREGQGRPQGPAGDRRQRPADGGRSRPQSRSDRDRGSREGRGDRGPRGADLPSS
jgi:Ca2+-binding EF-hand superfamily protein